MTATQTRLRRDTLTNLNLATPADGELAYNTTDDRLHVGNGALAGAIPHLNCYDDMKSYFHYALTTGSANAYVLTLPYAPSAYAAGMRVKFKASFSCTGSATINVNALGAKTFKKVLSGALSSLSSGDIISGIVYEAIYDGTDFQVFGVTPTVTESGMVLLGSVTASASATLDFTSLISATYDTYVFVLKNLRPATDSSYLWMRTSTNNGSTYSSGAADYGYDFSAAQLVGAGVSTENSTGTKILLNATSFPIGNLADEAISGIVRLVNPLNATSLKPVFFECVYKNASGSNFSIRGSGTRDSTADIDAVRFLMDSGNITSGEIDLYGMRA